MRDCWICKTRYQRAEGDRHCGSQACEDELARRLDEVRCVELLGTRYLRGCAAVALLLDETMGQVNVWRERRANSGFPVEIEAEVAGVKRRLYDPDEVVTWRASYVPNRGGQPVGTANPAWRGGAAVARRASRARNEVRLLDRTVLVTAGVGGPAVGVAHPTSDPGKVIIEMSAESARALGLAWSAEADLGFSA